MTPPIVEECMFIIGGGERTGEWACAVGKITSLNLREFGRNFLRSTLTWYGSTLFWDNKALINL